MPYVFTLPEWMDDYRIRVEDRFHPRTWFGRTLVSVAERLGRRLGQWRRRPLPNA